MTCRVYDGHRSAASAHAPRASRPPKGKASWAVE